MSTGRKNKKIVALMWLIILLIGISTAYAAHFVCGRIYDCSDGTSASWRAVNLYFDSNPSSTETCIVNPETSIYCCDAEKIKAGWTIGEAVTTWLPNTGDGYWSGPVSGTLSGGGYDMMPDMALQVNMSCGDSINHPNETCDANTESCTTGDGYDGTQDCLEDCSGFTECKTDEFCGDGIVNGLEACEDGTISCTTTDDYNGTKYCAADCSAYTPCVSADYCGDGIINGPEICDESLLNGLPNHCNALCSGITPPECGNGVTEGSEECDDANLENNDNCLSTCKLNTCGDGFTSENESCDSGALNGQPNNCREDCSGLVDSVCGNSIKEAGEDCDDGDLDNDDSCSNTCSSNICGDNICSSGEDCYSCTQDCGKCYTLPAIRYPLSWGRNRTADKSMGKAGIYRTRFNELSPDRPVMLRFPHPSFAMKDIIIWSKAQLKDVEFRLSDYTDQLLRLLGLDRNSTNIYQYIKVDKVNIEDNEIAKARLKFKVRKDWLAQRGLTRKDIAVERHELENDMKESLDISRIKEEGDYFTYETLTEGFSFFLVHAPAKDIEPKLLAMPEKASPKEDIIKLIEAIIVLALIFLFLKIKKIESLVRPKHRKRRKKK
jgi:PGF-pre-PGF domain-containing protein